MCGPGDLELGAPCVCDDACGADAPRCAPNAVEPDGQSYCTTECTVSSDCPAGYGCYSGTCQYCSVEPGMVPLMEACICDTDCAPDASGVRVECIASTCQRAGCLTSDPASCPSGSGCEEGVGSSTFCATCGATPPGTAIEGAACGCSAECTAGLVCRGGACRRTCALDADCGAQSCIHRTTETPSCQDPITPCTGDGSRTPGEFCDCNADCAIDGTFCLLGQIGEVTIDRCAAACTPGGGDCPLGTRCCNGQGTLSPTCLPEDVITLLADIECDL